MAGTIVRLALVTGFIVPLLANAQVREAWVQRFNTIGNAEDSAQILVSDTQGNFYVMGSTYQRYIILKYNASGELQWERSFEGRPTTACVDLLGNLYVGGVRGNEWWNYDFYIEKRDTNGTLLWNRSFDYGDNYDYLTRLFVDQSGHLYAIGTSDWWVDNPEGGGNIVGSFVAVKYSPAGEIVFVVSEEVARDSDIYYTHTTTAFLDTSGNIYIAGHVRGSEGLEYLTLKFSASGNLQWRRYYNAGLPGDDVPVSMAIDSAGNVYVSGFSRGASSVDFATVKYSPTGNQLWVQRYNGPNDEEDRPASIQVDSAGSVYVAGYSTGFGTGLDYTLIKYNPAGTRLWVRRYDRSNGEDRPVKMLLDASGAYLTGSSAGDYLTLKYDLNGNLLWAQVYSGTVSGR
ncbi:MAG: hypothetical protein NZM10_04875, partial [Fimbriimonadales bacterium]|nr:hypothetical protein [Fimbriimonadales bacterium]